MNRPFWLDMLYARFFFLPPVVAAAFAATALAQHYGWSFRACLLAYLIAVVIWFMPWLAGIIAWSRHRSESSGAGNSPVWRGDAADPPAAGR